MIIDVNVPPHPPNPPPPLHANLGTIRDNGLRNTNSIFSLFYDEPIQRWGGEVGGEGLEGGGAHLHHRLGCLEKNQPSMIHYMFPAEPLR